MKYFLTFIALFLAFCLNAQNVRPNHRIEVKPFTVKIDKIEAKNGVTTIQGKVKQQKRFSYGISFADCAIITDSAPDGIKGELVKWNDKKSKKSDKNVSDEDFDKFVLTFPGNEVFSNATIDLRLGCILDRDRTEILVKDIRIKKKK